MPSWNRLTPTAIAVAMCTVASASPSSANPQAMTGWSEKQLKQRLDKFAAITPEAVAQSVDLIDDDLEPTATLTTEKAYTFKGGFTDRVRADNFLRAIVDKKTGLVVYQVYARLRYTGELRRFSRAHFEDTDGPISVSLNVEDRRIDCSYGVCSGIEDVAFVVPEATLRSLAARADARPITPWRFRLKAENAQDWTDDIAPAEAAGLLIAVERYRSSRKLP